MGRSGSRSGSRTRDRKSESRDRRRRRSDSRDSSRSRSRRHRSRSRSHARSASRRSSSRDRQRRDDSRGRDRDRSRDRDRGGFADRGGAFGGRGRGRGRGRGGGGRGAGPWAHDQMAWNPSSVWEMGMWPPGGPIGGPPGGPPPPMGWMPPQQGPPGQAHPPPMWPGPPGAAGFAPPPPHHGVPPHHQPPAPPHPAHQEQQMAYEMPQISALAAYAFDVPLCRDLMSDNGFQDAIQQMYPDYSIDSDQRIGVDVVSDVEDAGYESSGGEDEGVHAEAKAAADTAEAKEHAEDNTAAVAADEGAEEPDERKPAKDIDDDDDDEDLYGDIATDDIAPIETEHAEEPLAGPAIVPEVQHLDAQHSLINKMKLRAIGAPVTKEHKRTVRRHFYESLQFTQPNVEPAKC